MKKQIVLTNWQVPRDPRMAGLDAVRQAAESNPIDMKNYENVGGVEHHASVASVAEKMIREQEARRGVRIDQQPSKASTVNLRGVNDTRQGRKIWSPGDEIEDFNYKEKDYNHNEG